MPWGPHLTSARLTGIAFAECLSVTSAFVPAASTEAGVALAPSRSGASCLEPFTRKRSKTTSDPAVVHMNRGRANLIRGALDHALADFNAAIRLAPERADAFIARGILFRRQGAYEHAVADLTIAIRLEPNNALAHAVRAAVYADESKDDLAFADLDQAIRLSFSLDDASE